VISARLALAILAATLAACGDVPKPFRHDGAAPPLARPKMERGVTIRPLAGYDHAEQLAAAFAKALEGREIPASVRTGPAFGHVVEGVIDGGVIDGGVAEGGVAVWSLKAPDGTEAATLRQRLPAQPDPIGLKRAAAEAMAVLAQPLSVDPDAIPRQAPGAARIERPSARLVTMAGLPGDGDRTLNNAIRTALGRAGVTIKDDGEFVVQGAVTVTSLSTIEDNVLVVWTVKRARDNSQVASIDQGGAVPRGRLTLPWGSLARDIAEGGAAGIAQAVRHAQAKGPSQPEASPPPPPPAAEPQVVPITEPQVVPITEPQVVPITEPQGVPTTEPRAQAQPAVMQAQGQPPPDPTMFTEPRPADIRAQDSSEQKTEARSAAPPAPAIMLPPPPRPSIAKLAQTVKTAKPVKVRAAAGNRAKAITKPLPSSPIKRAQR
jgi:hypothetical protein